MNSVSKCQETCQASFKYILEHLRNIAFEVDSILWKVLNKCSFLHFHLECAMKAPRLAFLGTK